MDVLSFLAYIILFFILYIIVVSLLCTVIFKYPHHSKLLKKWICKLNNYEFVGNDNVIFQDSSLSCGAACLEMVLIERNKKYTYEDLRELRNLRGTTFQDLLLFAEQLKLNGNYYQFNNEQTLLKKIKDVKIPFVALLNWSYFYSPSNIIFFPIYHIVKLFLKNGSNLINHWVVLSEVDDSNNFILLDPYVGKIKMRPSILEKYWNKYALIFDDHLLRSVK